MEWFNFHHPARHIYNEQTKLVATFLSNLGTAAFSLGVLTPFLTQEVKWIWSLPVGWGGGFLLHVIALQVLRQLYPHMSRRGDGEQVAPLFFSKSVLWHARKRASKDA
jgi:hypothetical protein